MKKVKGKIILVDSQKYEERFLERALREKNWDIVIEYFSNAADALEHLKRNADEIFLIISEMHMPNMSGMALKKVIDKDPYLRQKSIPFIFVCNSIYKETVLEAYHYHVQGYFQKPITPEEQAELFETIVQYWKTCIHPNKDDLPSNPFIKSQV